ncbi:unnamed protein product [Brassicogethes aeneus]|uniref:Uncharacterized protein n=1 Tax=Brassicogethes aeneus TaxID=1431903 RepID=A0A9P0FJN4_BRAAE|nr:unnamed protein product [Brassicogethes aeneus]
MYEISKKTMFQFWNDSSKENLIEQIFKSIVKHFSLKVENVSSSTQKQWKTVIKDFCNKINIRWRKSGKRIDRFLVRYDKWLENGSIYFVTATTEEFLKEKAHKIVGRPPKPFKEVLYKSKKQKVEHLLKSSTEEITFAAEIALRNDGKKDAANLVKEISSAAPGRSTEIKHLCEKENAQKPRQYSKEEALAIFVDCRLTKQSYINLRKSAIKAGHELYPSYKQIQEAKMECCPPEENIFINETRAEMIDLQALMDHTAKRLVSVQQSVLQQHASMMNLKVLDLILVSYKLNYKQWQLRGKEQQEEFKIRKQEIQKRFKNEMGLDVDKPKPGFGSSNDGNTARAFFNNPEKSSDITGVNKTLIKQLGDVLALLKCPDLPCFTHDDSSETSEDDSEHMNTEFDEESE